MPEAFKNTINPTLVRAIGQHLARADARLQQGFDRAAFEARALPGLDALELKARVLQLADALVTTLPADVDAACTLMEAALGPAGRADSDGSDLGTLVTGDAGLAGWGVWPLTEVVALIALDHPARGLQALHAMTQRMTAEFAIRPFIVRHPQLAFATLQRWLGDPSAHVRRLVSEGSRPRLPWGLRLQALVDDPAPTLPLLRALQDDPSEYVRRSVANHLNDIAKDHPALIARWLAEHLPAAPVPRQKLLKHACRTLIKQGDPAVLAAWGLGRPFRGEARLQLTPDRAAVGGELQLALALQSRSPKPQRLVIDYAVHHVKANGSRSPKVFKGWTLELQGHEQRLLQRRHSLKPVTTRRYHAGLHTVDLRINGRVVADANFMLRLG